MFDTKFGPRGFPPTLSEAALCAIERPGSESRPAGSDTGCPRLGDPADGRHFTFFLENGHGNLGEREDRCLTFSRAESPPPWRWRRRRCLQHVARGDRRDATKSGNAPQVKVRRRSSRLLESSRVSSDTAGGRHEAYTALTAEAIVPLLSLGERAHSAARHRATPEARSRPRCEAPRESSYLLSPRRGGAGPAQRARVGRLCPPEITNRRRQYPESDRDLSVRTRRTAPAQLGRRSGLPCDAGDGAAREGDMAALPR